MKTIYGPTALRVCVVFSLALCSRASLSQQQASLILPDAPGMTSAMDSDASSSSLGRPSVLMPEEAWVQAGGTATGQSAHEDKQTKRILGIIPNFRAVSANQHLPPQTVKDKFVTATQDSFDYSAIVLPVVIAGYSQLTNSTPEFGTGPTAYGRYLWHAAVDQTAENYMVEFFVPAAFHEDTRYYTLGSGGFVKRTEYSLSRVFITRSDSGKRTFNAGEVFGAGIAAGLSNLYYPAPERTAGNTIGKYGQSIGIDAATFLFKEYWPDINHHLFHHQDQD
jgi:hypothetical protein